MVVWGPTRRAGTKPLDSLPCPISQEKSPSIENNSCRRESRCCRKWSEHFPPGWMGPQRGSITTILNSFFIRTEPVADGAPPITWPQSWRIGFLQEWEIWNQGNRLSSSLPRSLVPFSYRTGSLSWVILIPSSQNSLIQDCFYDFQAVAGSWDFVQRA